MSHDPIHPCLATHPYQPTEELSVEPPDYSTWDVATHGPEPHPDWVVTELAAVDAELGVLKTGKEADVHLVARTAPDGRETLMAAKRYRHAEHRMFHRDAGYTEGRRVRRSRETRAMARRTDFGREVLAAQWAVAEFGALSALSALWRDGAPVPYPVQLHGTELMLEFIGAPGGAAAPRLAQLRPAPDELAELFEQCRRGDAAAGPGRVRPRRPVGLQPAGARGPAGDDRPAAGGRPRGQPARGGVPAPRLPQRVHLVRAARAWPTSSSSTCSPT